MTHKPEQDWCAQIDAPSIFDFVSALPAPCSGNWEPPPFQLRDPPGAQAASNAFFERRAKEPDEPPLQTDQTRLIDLRNVGEPVHRHKPSTSFEQFLHSYHVSKASPSPLKNQIATPRRTPRRVVSVNADVPSSFIEELNVPLGTPIPSRTPRARQITPARRARTNLVARALFDSSPVRPALPPVPSPRAQRGISFHRPRSARPFASPTELTSALQSTSLRSDHSLLNSSASSGAPHRRISPGFSSAGSSRTSGSERSHGAISKSKPRISADVPARTYLSDSQITASNGSSDLQHVSPVEANKPKLVSAAGVSCDQTFLKSDVRFSAGKEASPEPKIKKPRRVALPQRISPAVQELTKNTPSGNSDGIEEMPAENNSKLAENEQESKNKQQAAPGEKGIRQGRRVQQMRETSSMLDDILQSENSRILQERQRRATTRQKSMLIDKENVMKSFPVKETRVVKKKRATARVEFTSASSRRKATSPVKEESHSAVPAVLNALSPNAQESQPTSTRGLRGLRARTRMFSSHGTRQERSAPRTVSELDSAAATFGKMSISEKVKASAKEKRRQKKVESDLNSLLNEHNSRVQDNRNRRLATKR